MSDTTESSTREALLAELAELVTPLAVLSSPDDVAKLVRALGFDVPAITQLPEAFGLLVTGVDDVRHALGQLGAATTDDARKTAAASLLTAVTAVLGGAAGLASAIEAGFDELGDFVGESGLASELPRRLLDLVLLQYLIAKHGAIVELLLWLGLVDFVVQQPDAPTHRIDAIIPTVHWERIPLLFSNPVSILDQVYGWSTDFRADKFLARTMGFVGALGLPLGEFPQSSELADALHRPPDPRTEYRVSLLRKGKLFDAATAAEVGLRLCEVPPAGALGTGVAILPYAAGAATFVGTLAPGWTLQVKTALDITAGIALVLRPPQTLGFETGLLGGAAAAVSGKLGIGVRRAAPPDTEIILLGEKGKTRLAIREFGAALTGALGQPPELIMSVDVVGLTIAVVPADGDGFLKKVLPPEGIKASGDLGIDASTKTGFRFRGGAGFEVELPLKLSLGGVVELKSLWVRIGASAEGLQLALALTVVVKIGPVNGTVERIGLQAALVPTVAGSPGNFGALDLRTRFKPPAGAGLSVVAGPVSGGGYLFFDPDHEQYAGVLQLSFKTIGLTVIGLLTTRLPDASGAPGAATQGFSLLLIIAFDLPPIQLGYGFTLNGVGGLLGINRTMVVDALRNGVRNGTVDSILFPTNPVARAAEIISNLRSIFPPAQGRYVFGPMVKIGWGPNAILEFQAAVILELMAPIRLVVLGKVQAALPDKKDAIVVLRLDIVGVIDFDRSEVSVDASLVDSRIAAFAITGDMALRVGWGATKQFALAAGGFHPRFQPPATFPALGRLAISLANSDNPRLRLESYFALTTNSIQFGAALDIYASFDTFAGTFSVAALANFDALIQFQPFALMADLGASVDIARNSVPILHAALHASLSGPGPWHAIGYAEFDFIGKHRIAFEATVGEPAEQPPSTIAPAELATRLVEAFGRADAWGALPPADGERIVTLRTQPDGDRMLVHPLGALSVRQRLLPLDKVIERFGASVVASVTFTLAGFRIGGPTAPAAETLRDDFAPGQFTPLSDDDRVGRPAFEAMASGGRVNVTAFRVPTDAPAGASATAAFEDAIVDDEPALDERLARPIGVSIAALPEAVLLQVARRGAAGLAPTRAGGAADFVARNLALGVRGERYVAASTDTLRSQAGGPVAGASCAEALDRVAKTRPGAAQAALLHEAGP
ncbi:hypothetical protein LJR130_007091 [Variovorax sp. LjRoot130]|uniref:DUF6603 domain-containing protein n=1 Tax=Variovorax sp. LjRoot130 TaxID=3342261 RepID=UPI003ECF4FBE